MVSGLSRVLCCWDIASYPHILDRLREVAQVEIIEPTRDNLLRHIGGQDAYLASLHVRLDEAIIARADRLRLVATPSTGLDHLDGTELARRGIEVISVREEYELLDRVTATAEMAWCLLLAAVRQLPHAHGAVGRGEWSRDAFRGRQLSGLTLGVLGVGRLGTMVARYGQAFGMRVLGCDTDPRRRLDFVEYVDLPTLLRDSDVISIHVHLTDDNRGLLDADAFATMKDGVVIVNTSRGAIIDEAAMVDAIERGKVGGAGLDVVDGEWREDLDRHPLVALSRENPRVVISPHLGGVTYESQEMVYRFTANRVAEKLETG